MSDKAKRSTREPLWRWALITRKDGEPYLWRLRLLSTRWFGVYLHCFEASDDVCLHDHPWPYISVVLAGGYSEVTPAPPARWYRPGSVLLRPARWVHRIEIDPARKPLTLVIRGSRVREWGFHTPRGWIAWFRYSHDRHCPDS